MRVSPAGRLLPWVGGGLGSRSKQTERGYTLQTLIITAVLVLVAVGAALVLVAINRSSSDDFEEAGNIGIDGKCQTWEIHLATLEAAGHGGPEGHGGVFSSNIGCLATCYWEITDWPSGTGAGYDDYPNAYSVRNKLSDWGGGRIERTGHPHVSKLHYYDDNRAPAINHIRFGVVSLRAPAGATEPPGGFRDVATDHRLYTNRPGYAKIAGDGDGKILLHFVLNPLNPNSYGARLNPGRPLTQAMIDAGIPTIAEPNWMSFGDNPGAGVLATDYPDPTVPPAPPADYARGSWEDESWEVRADPGREVCEIVNVAHDDLLVCSSAAKDNLCESITSPLVIIPIPIG